MMVVVAVVIQSLTPKCRGNASRSDTCCFNGRFSVTARTCFLKTLCAHLPTPTHLRGLLATLPHLHYHHLRQTWRCRRALCSLRHKGRGGWRGGRAAVKGISINDDDDVYTTTSVVDKWNNRVLFLRNQSFVNQIPPLSSFPPAEKAPPHFPRVTTFASCRYLPPSPDHFTFAIL